MSLTLDDLVSPRIGMNVNGHRLLMANRIQHPHSLEPVEYAVFAASGAYFISIDNGNDPRLGRLSASSDGQAMTEAAQAIEDFLDVNSAAWNRRAVLIPR